MSAGREYEIKALFSPERRRDIEAHPLLAEALSGVRPMQMVSTYFDTDDLHLWRSGFSLRLRKTQDGIIQTLKQAGASGLDRSEWEWPLEAEQLDFEVLRDTPLQRCLDRHRTQLAPRFVVDVARTKFDIVNVETRIEGALDQGTIQGAGQSLPVCEIELELKHGAPEDVVSLARRLIGDLPLTPSVASKAERGFSLASGSNDTASPTKGLNVSVAAGTSVRRAFALLSGACVTAILHNAALIDTSEKMEAIHQTRVAIRRLRSAMLLFKRHLDASGVERVQSDLKWIAGLLGASRDCDVHQTDVFDRAAADLDAPFGADRLAAVMRSAQARAYDDVLEALRSSRWRLLLLDLLSVPLMNEAQDSDAPFELFVVKGLKKRRKRLLDMADMLEDLSPDERHDVRKKAKSLRYAMSFFEDGLPTTRSKPYRKTIKALGDLQESLGALHDHDALRNLLRTCATDPTAPIHQQDENDRIASLFAAGALAEQPVQYGALLKTAQRAFRKIKDEDPF